MLSKTQGLASDLLGHALDLEHDAAGLDDGHPLLGVTRYQNPCESRQAS